MALLALSIEPVEPVGSVGSLHRACRARDLVGSWLVFYVADIPMSAPPGLYDLARS